MPTTDYLKQWRKRIGPLGLTAAVHIALFWGWQMSRLVPQQPFEQAPEAIQWIMLPQPLRPLPEPRSRPRAGKPAPATSRPRTSVTPIATTASEQESLPAPVPLVAPGLDAPRLIDRLKQARGELGQIDAEIRKDRRGLITAPADSPELRMQRKMAEAADAVPNKWYQAPKVTEILDPGGYGRSRYKVVGALGTYCITVESNHAPDGLDTMKNGIKPKLTNCPKHEQAATRQEW
jgi:hypothetical protein